MTTTNPTGTRSQLPPISVTLGSVRLDTVYTWSGARAALRSMISDAYRPHGRLSHPNGIALEHEQHELAMLTAGPVNGLLVTSGGWAWADSIRAAQEGEHGLTAGDLAIVHDYSNGYSSWTIDAKCKIIAVNPRTAKVTVRITTWSASQFSHGETVVVHASRIRRRNGGR